MKTIVLALILAFPVAAQTVPRPVTPVDRKVAILDGRLALTPAQKTAIAPIVRSAEMQKHSLGMMLPQNKDAALKAVVDDERAKIRALLTVDQQAKYDKAAK